MVSIEGVGNADRVCVEYRVLGVRDVVPCTQSMFFKVVLKRFSYHARLDG